MLPDYESLDLFYLGDEKDPDAATDGAPLLYKNDRFTTHAAIIGMTGSGKTGLGIALLEEAILDGIPLIAVDPKGDMGNLALAFRELDPDAMAPWMDEGEAQRRTMSTLELAREKADLWKAGLERSRQGMDRLSRYADKADITVYTPGSTSGVSVNVLGSFAAPPPQILEDADTLASLLHAAATGLLALIGEAEADDGTDPGYLLIVSLLRHYWLLGQDLDIESLIGAVVHPPFTKLGLLDLTVVYPQKARLGLAMKLNGVVASPTFAAWTQGEPLDVERMLYTPQGTPRAAVFYLAHLGEAQRMFFVTMLLGRVVEWMRTQSGSARLRALLYMDEVFGYFPPSKNTPAKASMLLLLKQARAFGVGVVLSTQNPADLDYRALSNIGTWFIGRLQTARDREKVLQGIGGDETQKQTLDGLIADLPGRSFVLFSAKEKRPILFSTRWVLSYLKGPLSKSDIARLTPAAGRVLPETHPSTSPTAAPDAGAVKPLFTLPLAEAYADGTAPMETARYIPTLCADAQYRFVNAARGIDLARQETLCLDLRHTDAPHWADAVPLPTPMTLQASAKSGAAFAPLPAWFTALRSVRSIEKALIDHLYAERSLELLRCASLKMDANPGESAETFQSRVRMALERKIEEEAHLLKTRFAKREQRHRERLARLVARLEKEKADVSGAVTDSVMQIGLALFDLLGGGSRVRGGTSKAARGIRKGKQALDERGDVAAVQSQIETLQEQIAALENAYATETAALKSRYSLPNHPIVSRRLKPRKSDIRIDKLTLVWRA